MFGHLSVNWIDADILLLLFNTLRIEFLAAVQLLGLTYYRMQEAESEQAWEGKGGVVMSPVHCAMRKLLTRKYWN